MSSKNSAVLHSSNTLSVTVELYSLKHSNFDEEIKRSVSAFSLNSSWIRSFSNSAWFYYGAEFIYFYICLVTPYVLYLAYVFSALYFVYFGEQDDINFSLQEFYSPWPKHFQVLMMFKT